MRLAIVSSPRSGNTFVRATLASTLQWEELAIHDYREAPDVLPSDLVLQLHWPKDPDFLAWLSDREFRVLTLARNPLDVLLSAVRFSIYEPQVARWLEGRTLLPCQIGPDGSASAEFLSYCLSRGAEELLSVTPQWWTHPGPMKLRYEDLVDDPIETLSALVKELGGTPELLLSALERNSVQNMSRWANRHGWRGRPGHWRSLLPGHFAMKIQSHHHRVFEVLGYPLGYSFQPAAYARRNWQKVA